MLNVKQGGIKYHFLSLWYDSTWDWTKVSRTIGEFSTYQANGPIYIYIYIYIYSVERWNCHPRKDMIPFLFNENRFSFFVADHLLVGQLCTNSKSDRSLLLCLKVTQCSTSELWQQDHYQHPQNANLDCHELRGRALGDENKVSGYGYSHWCSFKWGPHHSTFHLRRRLESKYQRLPGCAEECGDPLVQSGGQWQTLGVAAGLGTGPQVQRDSDFASEGLLRLCTLLWLAPSSPDLSPLDYFLWSYVENITNMTSHNTKASMIATNHRAPSGTCGKDMLLVPDPYQGGDWGWRRLHWIDASCTS